MAFLDVLKKFDGVLVKENKKLRNVYLTILKESDDEKIVKEEEEKLQKSIDETIEEDTCEKCDSDPCVCDEAEDGDIHEADSNIIEITVPSIYHEPDEAKQLIKQFKKKYNVVAKFYDGSDQYSEWTFSGKRENLKKLFNEYFETTKDDDDEELASCVLDDDDLPLLKKILEAEDEEIKEADEFFEDESEDAKKDETNDDKESVKESGVKPRYKPKYRQRPVNTAKKPGTLTVKVNCVWLDDDDLKEMDKEIKASGLDSFEFIDGGDHYSYLILTGKANLVKKFVEEHFSPTYGVTTKFEDLFDEIDIEILESEEKNEKITEDDDLIKAEEFFKDSEDAKKDETNDDKESVKESGVKPRYKPKYRQRPVNTAKKPGTLTVKVNCVWLDDDDLKEMDKEIKASGLDSFEFIDGGDHYSYLILTGKANLVKKFVEEHFSPTYGVTTKFEDLFDEIDIEILESEEKNEKITEDDTEDIKENNVDVDAFFEDSEDEVQTECDKQTVDEDDGMSYEEFFKDSENNEEAEDTEDDTEEAEDTEDSEDDAEETDDAEDTEDDSEETEDTKDDETKENVDEADGLTLEEFLKLSEDDEEKETTDDEKQETTEDEDTDVVDENEDTETTEDTEEKRFTESMKKLVKQYKHLL